MKHIETKHPEEASRLLEEQHPREGFCNGGPYLVLSSNHNKDGRYFHSNV